MNWVKYVIGLACLFAASCVAIVYGYYNEYLGLRISATSAFRELPILTPALFMTVSCPVTHIIAFRKFPEDIDGFAIFGLGAAFFVALIVVSWLPDKSVAKMTVEAPLWRSHPLVMYFALVGAFYGIYHWLHLDFWRFAKRES